MNTSRVEELTKELTEEVEKRKAILDREFAKKIQMLIWFEEHAPSLINDIDTSRVTGDIHIRLPMEMSALRRARKLLGVRWRFSFNWFLDGKYATDGHNGFACSYRYTGKALFAAYVHLVMTDTTDKNASHRMILTTHESAPEFDLIPI